MNTIDGPVTLGHWEVFLCTDGFVEFIYDNRLNQEVTGEEFPELLASIYFLRDYHLV